MHGFEVDPNTMPYNFSIPQYHINRIHAYHSSRHLELTHHVWCFDIHASFQIRGIDFFFVTLMLEHVSCKKMCL